MLVFQTVKLRAAVEKSQSDHVRPEMVTVYLMKSL